MQFKFPGYSREMMEKSLREIGFIGQVISQIGDVPE